MGIVLQKAERLQATLHLTGQAQPQQKTVFEDEGDVGRMATAAMLDAGASDSDDACDLHENVPEASGKAAVDAGTAARVSKYDSRCSYQVVCARKHLCVQWLEIVRLYGIWFVQRMSNCVLFVCCIQ